MSEASRRLKRWLREKREKQSRRKNLNDAEQIIADQKAGKITPWEASRRADEMFMRNDPGTLIYYSDSTGLTAEWDPDVMLMAKVGSTRENRIPSNTGIHATGPQRGWFETNPRGAAWDCDPEMLDHFRPGCKGWIGGEVKPGTANADPEAEPNPAGGKQ